MNFSKKMDPYNEGRNLFVEWCSVNKLAVPIEFGTIGCPGLSDIDIGIVFKEPFDPHNSSLRKDLASFPEKTKELMNGGTLMFFPEAVFKHISLIDDIRVRSLTDAIDVNEVTSDEKYLVDLVQIIEWLPERIATIHSELEKTNINHKRLVGFFYSLCYSLKKIQEHAGENKQISDFIDHVHNLRKEWLSLETDIAHRMLKDISNLYMSVFMEAVKSITPVLDDHFDVSRLCKLQYNICKNVHFVANHDDIGIFGHDDNIYISVPAAFLCTYFAYSKYNSCLGSIIAQRMSVKSADITISEEMSNILGRRAHILGSLFDFVKALNCGSGLYKFGWYLNE